MEDVLERLEPWMAKIESETCRGCPAFRWVIPGQDKCRLGFEIENANGRPAAPCLRPQTVGASYVIARELGRPEPLVGKLDSTQYNRYVEEKEAAGC